MRSDLQPESTDARLESRTFWSSLAGSANLQAYLFLTPLLVLMIGFIIYPFVAAIWLSLFDKTTGSAGTFIGLGNYLELIQDPVFQRVILNTCIYAFGAVALKLVFGLFMALTLNQDFKGRTLARGALLLPWIIPTAVSTLVWMWMYNDIFGVINQILVNLGIVDWGLPWLGEYRLAMIAIILVDVWRGTPFFGITTLAGLQTIPSDIYEAAEIDGAIRFRRFWYITLPQLKGVLIITSMLSLIWTFGEFQIIYILTRGGPGRATHVFSTYTYEIAFLGTNLGKGVAVSLFILPFLAIAVFFLTRYLLQTDDTRDVV